MLLQWQTGVEDSDTCRPTPEAAIRKLATSELQQDDKMRSQYRTVVAEQTCV